MCGALRACCLSIEIEHNRSEFYSLKLINMETEAIAGSAVLNDY